MKTTHKNNQVEQDLAGIHHPISKLFAQPQSPEEWKQYMLPPEQIDFFRENGYLSGVKILTELQVDQLTEELARLHHLSPEEQALFYHYKSNESADPSRVLFHALGAWRVAPGFHDLLWAPAFRMAAYQLLGQPYRFFHDQLFCKPAQHGGVVAWHQDFSYWTWTQPMAHLTCWIGLDDANEENGCLYYVPRSHRWGLLPITGLAGDMEAVREVLDEEQQRSFDNQVANVLGKGYASFHHPITMHGSYANHSERQRRAVVLNVMAQDTRSNIESVAREDELKGFPVKPQGELMDGKYYPLLFDPEKELGYVMTSA